MGSPRTERRLHEAFYNAQSPIWEAERAIRDARSIMRLTLEQLNGIDREAALRTMIGFWVTDHGAA